MDWEKKKPKSISLVWSYEVAWQVLLLEDLKLIGEQPTLFWKISKEEV
jgi:hypothetical protein